MIISIVTPAKDEIQNVKRLVASVSSQSNVFCWIIVDDGSRDGTGDAFTHELGEVNHNTRYVKVIRRSNTEPYQLGTKYSGVVRYGLEYLWRLEKEFSFRSDLIGILDADVFPQPGYYSSLVQHFSQTKILGIASGRTYIETVHGHVLLPQNRYWASGNCRLWRRECLAQTGYQQTISADAVTAARAVILGWSVRCFSDISVIARPLGSRNGYEYYGRSMYQRHVPFVYLMLSASRLTLHNHTRKEALSLVRGYMNARRMKEPRIGDSLATRYFRFMFFYRVMERFRYLLRSGSR